MNEALVLYKKALDKKDAGDIRCEYAFALAKLGMLDAALAELDLAAASSAFPGSGQWFRCKILRAAGADGAADELGEGAEAPDWLGAAHREISGRVSGGATLNERFLNANDLAAQGRLHAAVAEFAAALKERPGDFLGWIGYSLALEKIEAIQSARKALAKAAPLVGNSGDRKELFTDRQAQLKELGGLKEARRSAQRKKQLQTLKLEQGRSMLFGGGSFGPGSSAFLGRYGYFVAPKLDAAIDISLSGLGQAGATSQVGLGLSGRYYWPFGEKAGALALGARVSHAGDQNSLTVSPGYTSPLGDLFIDIALNSTTLTIGLTVGGTNYFGGKP